MRIMLVACLLLAVARAQPNFLTCFQLCNSGIDPSKWRKNCDCLDEIATGVRSLNIEQDDKSIYYEPTDLYLRHLSFLNPPFYIINPNVKLKIEATDPKFNIRKPKTQNDNNIDLQTFVNYHQKNNIVNNNEASLKLTKIDLDVSSEEVSGAKRLTKNADCIELHYANSHYGYNTLKLNNDDSTRIKQKCYDSVGPQALKNKRPFKSKELFKENYSTEQGLFTIQSERANSTDISNNNTLDNQNHSSKDETKESENYNQDATIPPTGHILTAKRQTDEYSSTVNMQGSLYSTFKTNNVSAINTKVSKRPQQVSDTNSRNSHDLFGSVEILDLLKAPVENHDVFNTDTHLFKNSKETEKSLKQISRKSVTFDEHNLKEYDIPGNSKKNKIMLSNAEDITTQHLYNSNGLISTQSAVLSSENSYAKDDNIDKDIDKLKLFDDVTTFYTRTTSVIRLPVPNNSNNIKPNDFYVTNDQLEFITEEENRTLTGKVENDSSTKYDSNYNLSFKFQNNNTNQDKRTISKIMTREFENGTVVSRIGSHISETRDNSPQDFASRYKNVTAINYMKLIQSETIEGKMYFIFNNNVHIPAQFKQNENGDISVGIDGLALCSKLSFAVKSLINTMCSEIVK